MKWLRALVLAVIFGGWTFGAANIAFEQQGAQTDWDPTVGQPALYASSTNTLWFFWEGWRQVSGTYQHVTQVVTKNLTGNTWTGVNIAGTASTLTSDDPHGVPSVVRDPTTKTVYCFYGAHGGNLQISQTTNPDDPTAWTATTLHTGTYQAFTFPRGFVVGSTLYLFYMSAGNGIGIQEALVVITATIASDGSLSWSPTRHVLFDSAGGGQDGWLLPGNFYQSGSSILVTFNYGTTIGAYPVSNIYAAYYDTVTGNVSNFAGNVTVVPGSQPISKATMDASFIIYNATGVSTAGVVVDDAGATHVVLTDGNLGSNGEIVHMVNSGSGWSTPHVVYTFPNGVSNAENPEITKGAGGSVNVFFADGTFASASVYAAGAGNILTANRSSAGVWTANSTVLNYAGFGLGHAAQLRDGPASARVVFTQMTNDGIAISGSLRGYAYGDSGFVGTP